MNHNSEFAEKIHIRQLDLININPIGRHNAPNWQEMTS